MSSSTLDLRKNLIGNCIKLPHWAKISLNFKLIDDHNKYAKFAICQIQNMNFKYNHDVTFPYGDIMVKQKIFQFGMQMFQLNIMVISICHGRYKCMKNIVQFTIRYVTVDTTINLLKVY